MKCIAAIAGLVLSTACASISSTPALVARFEGRSLRVCRVALGWTEAELVEECGAPIARAPLLGSPDQCLIYNSEAHALGMLERVAPYFGVCLSEPRFGKSRDPKVSNVIGLASIPTTLTSTASR